MLFKLCVADGVDVTGEVQHLAGEAPLIVVPSDELDKVLKMPKFGIFRSFSILKKFCVKLPITFFVFVVIPNLTTFFIPIIHFQM